MEFSSGMFFIIWGLGWLMLMHPSLTILPRVQPSSADAYSVNSARDADKSRPKPELAELVAAHAGRVDTALVVGVLTEDGASVFGYGAVKLGGNIPPDGDTLFELGSITKVFTSIALLETVQNTGLQLEQSVRDLLPADAAIPAGNGQDITLLDLATHTSSLPKLPFPLMRPTDFLFLRILHDPYERMSEQRVLRYLHRRGLEREPAVSFTYSNFGMGLLGYALATSQECSYEELITSTICEPLGMEDTVISLSPNQRQRLADGVCGHVSLGQLCLYLPCERWNLAEPTQGAGALCSTANDMLRFLAANLDLMENELLRTLEQCHEPRRSAGGESHIGLGWLISEKDGIDGSVLWHNGGTGGHRSFMALSKANRTGVVVLASSTRLVDDIGWAVLRGLVKEREQESRRPEGLKQE